ncbi:MAG TPA: acetate/propionate family kinase [Chthoniobacteraceae bacterium]|jgi:acetate kinase|nr:acetate/propionate family kinase [Chthoniobacteraceae bacterium]
MSPDQILVANIGTTSFKFRLFEMPGERVLASGGVERIGGADSAYKVQIGDGPVENGTGAFPGYDAAIALAEQKLGGFGHLAAVGFKPVMARGISGTQVLDDRVLGAMEQVNTLLPAHNPPYIAAVRSFQRTHPELPCIGTFETAFYDHVPLCNRRYPVPLEWEEKYGVRRHGFHGASHRYVTERCAELRGTDKLRLISCHLGGSSSVAAVLDGKAINSSWGMTPQSGLPQNNRVGDFDVFALIYLARDLGLGIDAVEKALTSQAGLKGMSGLASGDMRDLVEAKAKGNENAAVALEVFAGAIRKYIGQFLVELNGADAILFAGGIGENNPELRADVCANLDFCGLELDPEANAKAHAREAIISTPRSKIEVRVIPTNEELIIARNAWQKLSTLKK